MDPPSSLGIYGFFDVLESIVESVAALPKLRANVAFKRKEG